MITRELEAFVTTANVGSFQKASDLLFISSTALIKQINALEEETGLTLFIRTNRGIQLTEEGKIFHGIARDILQRYALGIQAARNKRAELGTPIRIGLSPMSPFMSFAEEMLPENDLNRYFTLEFLPSGCLWPCDGADEEGKRCPDGTVYQSREQVRETIRETRSAHTEISKHFKP